MRYYLKNLNLSQFPRVVDAIQLKHETSIFHPRRGLLVGHTGDYFVSFDDDQDIFRMTVFEKAYQKGEL